MVVANIYSKRKKALERAENDVYGYDQVPDTLRSQLRQLFNEAYENYSKQSSYTYTKNFKMNADTFDSIVRLLRKEYGRDSLISHARSSREELTKFLNICETDEFLDCAELYGRLVVTDNDLDEKAKSNYLYELNHRLKEAFLGYEFVEKKIIRIDSTLLHSEVLKPTLAILSTDPKFKGAEQEILSAFEKFRLGDNKGAAVDALKSFESVMKSILERQNFEFGKNDPAAKLIAACFKHNLLPDYLQSHFNGLRTVLESGVPAVRNKTAGHGQGSSVRSLDDHFVSYILYTALANMKLLIECEKDMAMKQKK